MKRALTTSPLPLFAVQDSSGNRDSCMTTVLIDRCRKLGEDCSVIPCCDDFVCYKKQRHPGDTIYHQCSSTLVTRTTGGIPCMGKPEWVKDGQNEMEVKAHKGEQKRFVISTSGATSFSMSLISDPHGLFKLEQVARDGRLNFIGAQTGESQLQHVSAISPHRCLNFLMLIFLHFFCLL